MGEMRKTYDEKFKKKTVELYLKKGGGAIGPGMGRPRTRLSKHSTILTFKASSSRCFGETNVCRFIHL